MGGVAASRQFEMRALYFTVALVLGLVADVSAAQAPATASDIERLHDALFEAGTAIARLRTGDGVLRKELQAETEDIRTAATELGARLRAGESVAWDAYATLRRRIGEVKRRARSHVTVTGAGLGPAARAPYPADKPPPGLEIPAGAELKIRLLVAVDPRTARDGDPVEAATVAAYADGETVIVPAGSLVRGMVEKQASESGQCGAAQPLTVRFEDVLVAFTTHPIDATVTDKVTGPLKVGALLRLRFE